jgi:hypothetical protein
MVPTAVQLISPFLKAQKDDQPSYFYNTNMFLSWKINVNVKSMQIVGDNPHCDSVINVLHLRIINAVCINTFTSGLQLQNSFHHLVYWVITCQFHFVI